jgi:hypothetical protein
MKSKRIVSLALIALGALAASAAVSAQTTPARLTPFNEYRAGLASAKSTAFVGRAEVRVKQAPDFEEMRQHLTKLYATLTVTHSFALESDTYDCIPVTQQPAVRLQGIRSIAEAPPSGLAAAGKPAVGAPAKAEESLHPTARAVQTGEATQKDKFGNSTKCEANTIPMRRVTLEEMTRFPTLHEFFAKGPNPTVPPQAGKNIPPCTGPSCLHKYSVFNQTVNNWGGNSVLNLWSPPVNTGAGEDFSLTQHWYVGGSGKTLPGLQTVEVGWQNYPNKYGDQRSRLFIYHTADGYNTTGCYNLDCGDFVQTNGSVYLGGGFTNYSTNGGAQGEFSIQVQFFRGNWWIFYQGTAFGYYPGSLFHGGQLTRYATNVQYGTESTGTNLWPGEGSGQWPSTGWSHAAYQRDLFYINTSAQGIWENLSPWNVAPCYNLSGPFTGSGAWQLYFYDGGPGGHGC